ncbi:YkgJ family cysteine cluster protein [Undibacterium curvum]|uniref:YkgJ family cysteine cluster protein n=1 Tax=Undibacterium curvum TaxID=2762294 RepID=UPI003D0F6937
MALSQQEQQAFLSAIERVKQDNQTLLENSKQHPVWPLHVIPRLHGALDLIASQSVTTPAVACAAGCSHCCHHRTVEVNSAEASFIVYQWIAERRDIDALRVACQAYVDAYVDAHASGQRQACPLLQDQHCSIYAYRPAVCRKAHSLDLAACASQAAHIPQQLERVLKSEAWIEGVTRALDEFQTQQHQPLAQALLQVLDALERQQSEPQA